MATQPLIINNWNNGMAESPHMGGLSLLKRVNIEEFPGAVKVSKALASLFHDSWTRGFTANAGTDTCTLVSGTDVPITGTAVTFTNAGGALPAPLSAGTIYFIIQASTSTFQVATTLANANATTAINITDAGTGTHTATTVNPGTVNHIVSDPRTSDKFFQDSNGRVWFIYSGETIARLIPGNTLTGAAGNGLGIFRTSDGTSTYLFVFRNAAIDVINVYGTTQIETPTWSNSWKSLNSGAGSGNSHHCVLGQDNMLYFCDDRYIGSIRETAGYVFDPDDVESYTFNNQALDLPQNEIANWMDELGTNLLIAGLNYDKIYPWDRISDSFSLPLQVPEYSIKKIKNLGNIIYILAGAKGNIYTTQGTYVKHFKKLPDYAVNNTATLQPNSITWGGIAIKNGALIFGVLSYNSSENSGVWILYPDGRLLLDNIPTTAGTAKCLFADNDFYYIGYTSGADYSTTIRYTNYEGIVHTELFKVGTKTDPATYSTIEVQIAKPASSGHVRIKYRTDTSSTFNTTALITCTADSTNTSFKSDVGLINIENIQLQVEIDGLMELVEVRLLP
jgi:hypothetical protein